MLYQFKRHLRKSPTLRLITRLVATRRYMKMCGSSVVKAWKHSGMVF